MRKRNEQSRPSLMRVTLLLVLLALAAMSAATMAWLSIADHGRIQSMNMDITAGQALRFDLDPHPELADYLETLNERMIYARIQAEQGYDPFQTPLEPVTTQDGLQFFEEDGSPVDPASGWYQRFTLHFMAGEAMYVHLTSAPTFGMDDGTRITSSDPELPYALRIAFTCDGVTHIYDPGAAEPSQLSENCVVFGLPPADRMVYNVASSLFAIDPGVDKAVEVAIWLEGTDEACTDAIRSGDYAIQLRFQGVDENGQPIIDRDRTQ